MITALSEYVDVLYTKAATELPPEMWWVIEVAKGDLSDINAPQPSVRIKARTFATAEHGARTYKTDVPFAAVEEGARCSVDVLATVAEHHIKRLKLAMMPEPMMQAHDKPWLSNAIIETASGGSIDLSEPLSASVTVEDIAHHLAQVNRYAGACKRPYSVAEHAVLVSRRTEAEGEDWITCLGALHHDDPEAYIHDLTRPLKTMVKPLYRAVEDRMQTAVDIALGLPALTVDQEAAIKAADNWALAKEAYVLMPSKGRGWWCDGLYDCNAKHENTSQLKIPLWMDWDDARVNYLHWHNFLVSKIKEESK